MEPYFDPLWHPLNALERSIEQSFEPAVGYHPHPDDYMDDWGRTAGALEASIEGTVIPPPAVPEIESPAPDDTWQDVVQTPASDGPPLPPEPTEQSWISLEPPPAARPYFVPHGIEAHSYRPRAHMGTGVRSGASRSTSTQWCPELNEFVDEETCRNCDKWGDHGGGTEQCYYEWLEENQE